MLGGSRWLNRFLWTKLAAGSRLQRVIPRYFGGMRDGVMGISECAFSVSTCAHTRTLGRNSAVSLSLSYQDARCLAFVASESCSHSQNHTQDVQTRVCESTASGIAPVPLHTLNPLPAGMPCCAFASFTSGPCMLAKQPPESMLLCVALSQA